MKSNFPLNWGSNYVIIKRAYDVGNWKLALAAIKRTKFYMDNYFIGTYYDFYHIPCIKEYLDSKYDHQRIEEKVEDLIGKTTIHKSIAKGCMVSVKLFIKHKKVDLNCLCEDGLQTPTHLAIIHKRKDILSLIIEARKVNLNIKNHSNESPFVMAINGGYDDFVEILIRGGAKIELEGIKMDSALSYALKDGNSYVSLPILLHCYRSSIKGMRFSWFGRKMRNPHIYKEGFIWKNTSAFSHFKKENSSCSFLNRLWL